MNEKIMLMAEANKLGIDGYRKMSVDDLKAAIKSAQGTGKGKGKVPASAEVQSATAKGKGKTAASNGTVPAKGKGKAATSTTTAKRAPAKSTAQKTAPAKGKAAQGTAKRPATGGKGKSTATARKTTTATTAKKATSTRKPKQAVGRVNIDNKAIDWKAESNVGQTGKRKEVLDSLRKHKGDKIKVFNALVGRAKSYYPSKSKAEAERMLVWLIGRVAYDFVFKTGQHEPGERAAYGTSESAQDIRRREQREEARKASEKATRAAKRAGASQGRAKGKATTGKGKSRAGR